MELIISFVCIALITFGVNIRREKNEIQKNIKEKFNRQREELLNTFLPSKEIKITGDDSEIPTELWINERNNEFAILIFETEEYKIKQLTQQIFSCDIEANSFKEKYDKIEKNQNACKFIKFRFEDLLDYELLESTESKFEGRGLLSFGGGLLLGCVGAIAGANAGNRKICKDKSFITINIQVNNINTPFISIKLFDINNMPEFLYDSYLEKARKIIAILSCIKNTAQHSIKINNNEDILSKIEKLSELKNKNIITNDEFEKSKYTLLKKLNNS